MIFFMMNSQESLATGYSPHQLVMRPTAVFLHKPYREDSYSLVGARVREQEDKVNKAKALL